MARNCEKKLIGLNRMYIKKHQEEERKKNPQRPSLHTLHNAQEVKKWIPGIKKELDYCLEQLSGARQHQYPERKVKEFEERVTFLEKEYKRFVNKVYELDPCTTGIPWKPRGYVSKRKAPQMKNAEKQGVHLTGDCVIQKISSPLMDQEVKEKTIAVSQSTSEKDSKLLDVKKKSNEKGLLNLDYDSSSDEET